MRAVVFVLLIAALMFSMRVRDNRKKIEASYGKAMGIIQHNPLGAYEAARPMFGFGDVTSLGHASSRRRKFFEEMTRWRVAELREGPITSETLVRTEVALAALKEAEETHKQAVGRHRLELIEAVVANCRELAESADLKTWDQLLDSMGNAESFGWAPSGASADFQSFLEEIRRVARRDVAFREARRNMTEGMREGIRRLGQNPSLDAAAPLIGALAPKIPSSDLIAADGAFRNAAFQAEIFRTRFPDAGPQPELEELVLKTKFNLTAMRASHVVDESLEVYSDAEAQHVPSDYLVSLYIVPGANTDVVPTVGEMSGSFYNEIVRGLGELIEATGRPNPAIPADQAGIVRAAAWWIKARFEARMRWGGTQAAETFARLKGEMAASEAGRQALRALDANPPGCILLR